MDTNKALEWLTDVLSVQGRVLTVQDTRRTVAEWDSLGDLMLLSRLEEELGIVVSADDVATMSSVKEVFNVMEQNNAFSVSR
jgi:acyl carrier protein